MNDTPTPFTFSDLMDWVATECGVVVNFHDLLGVTLESPYLHLRADQHFHHGPYCEFAKRMGNQPACATHKQSTLEKAKTAAPFESVCPQGIWDYCAPVMFDGELAGVFYLGSLSDGRRPAAIRGKEYPGACPPIVTPKKKSAVSRHARLLVDTMRLSLSHWVVSGGRSTRRRPLNFYAAATQRFIQNAYSRDIALTDLAAQLRIHPNYLGRMIKTAHGKSFRELLADYRIEKAKVMLTAGGYTVTETAYACGFNDGNYFSTVFRRRAGVSPRQYKREYAAISAP